ncbi:hypothetical protein CLOM_g9695 [Closterium sp. NIES-68]|nr:hypothetical protein CLOM_g9695 [Closterium sp. NIES-68]GJP58546.1 hypothetical protein CLOP_g399 [Closterium sp. NIES-67]
MKFGKEFESYQTRLQESSDLPARFPQVDYRALKKILRRCISSRALRAELRAQAEREAKGGGEEAEQLEHGAEERAEECAQAAANNAPPAVSEASVGASQGCALCDSEFFGLLEAELVSIEKSFGSAATRLLSCHNATGFQLMCHVLSPRQLFSGRAGGPLWHSHKPASLHHAATSLLEHLAISFLATHKILKKYIKVHRGLNIIPATGKSGDLYHTHAKSSEIITPEAWEHVVRMRGLQGRIIRSPLLIEVTAMVANLELALGGGGRGGARDGGKNGRRGLECLKACGAERRGEGSGEGRGEEGSGVKGVGSRVESEEGSSGREGNAEEAGHGTTVCPLRGSELLLKAEFKAKVDVTCPVCLEVPFDPVSLACAHIFCLGCACSVAHIPVFFGLDTASPHITCPLCRQQGVFGQPRSLKELQRLIMARQPEQWRAKRDEEQKRRLEQERRYWDGQMRIAMHIR